MPFWKGRISLLISLQSWLVVGLSLVPVTVAAELTTRSSNTTLPAGLSNHGNPNLICTPTGWSDVAFFFLGNYAAHAGTITLLPGEATIDAITAMVFALLFPSSGALRGIYSIWNSTLTRDPLQTALKAQALCMVVRTPNWRPKSGDHLHTLSYVSQDMSRMAAKVAPFWSWKKVHNWLKEQRNPAEELNSLKHSTTPQNPVRLSIQAPPWLRGSYRIVGRRIHGNLQLPDGYTLALVPSDALVESSVQSTDDSGDFDMNRFKTEPIAVSYSLPKALIAVAQTAYASTTLYRSRGDQIRRYGYAAFGLTVVPYLVMSVINLLSTLITPEYSAFYLVGSDIMKEAQARGGCFPSVVGQLVGEEVTVDGTFIFSGSFKECNEAPDHDLNVTDDDRESRKTFEFELTSVQMDNDAFEERPRIKESVDTEGQEPKSNVTSEITPLESMAPSAAEQNSSVIWAFSRTTPENIALAGFTDPIEDKPSIAFPVCYNFQRKTAKSSHLDCMYPFFIKPGFVPMLLHLFASPSKLTPLGLLLVAGGISLAIIGGISRFQSGSSTLAQRAWVMTWIVYGTYAGPLWRPSLYRLSEAWRQLLRARRRKELPDSLFFGSFVVLHVSLLVACIYAIPAIGGFVVVAKMLWEYGNCRLID
ncbi:uncharacterized protein PV07_09306 [Cladophialophora immunda]|uniref:Uncharacterized protein n=1 Tax=Cladophialophora immunda TaxID=569365 RepID=A0A0D2AM66_9EURO|nr:uncharacterized protein PV07_09306 [Cladophialophora immunda]KIW26192.1 hypothetical protein PV07_09306 [Cladophialophora immunda]OQU96020.1 hypothetical protein CLAIMM_02163 [Cladophialophora immunda]